MIKTHPFFDFFRFGNFQLKARVYCQWQEKGGPYYPGRIVGINKRGQFLVQYDDGTFYSYCIYIFSTFFPTVTYPTTTFLFFRFVPDFFVHCFFFFHHIWTTYLSNISFQHGCSQGTAMWTWLWNGCVRWRNTGHCVVRLPQRLLFLDTMMIKFLLDTIRIHFFLTQQGFIFFGHNDD